MLFWIVGILLVLALAIFFYLRLPKFGQLPDGERLSEIQNSSHYKNGEFTNLVDTPLFSGDQSFIGVLYQNLTTKAEHLRPEQPLPTHKTDLKALDPAKDLVVWLGHSSFFIQLGGKRLLVDPVFSEDAAPVPYVNRPFDGTNIYTAEDIPAVDALLITHDHWDHLDYPTLKALRPKIKRVVAGLGIGADFEAWGFDPKIINEGEWGNSYALGDGVKIHFIPARHYSGRSLKARQTLWTGYVLESDVHRMLISGDSGYGPHFAALGERFGGFDLVALDSGQYDKRWPYIHMNPEEAGQAAEDLKTKVFLPIHVAKFALAKHPWYEPLNRVQKAVEGKPYKLMTPLIGDAVSFDEMQSREYTQWWKGLK